MSTERGPSGLEETSIEDRVTAALMSVSSRIEVVPRAFDPDAAAPSRGRSPAPARSPLRWVAAAALVVGLTGAVVLSQGPVRDDVVTTGGEDDGSPVDYEAPTDGTVDPKFSDFVAPVNGEDGRSAELIFLDGFAWARAKTITPCLKGSGLADSKSPWALAMADWYAFNESSAQARLPALRAIAEDGMDRPGRDGFSTEVSEAVARCAELDTSKASSWMRDVERLQGEFAVSIDEAIAEAEAGPAWDAVQLCMTGYGAPSADGRGVPHAGIGDYLDWLTEMRASGGSPEVKAFVECARSFYAEVEQALAEPRQTFLVDHHAELLQLQTDFASFA